MYNSHRNRQSNFNFSHQSNCRFSCREKYYDSANSYSTNNVSHSLKRPSKLLTNPSSPLPLQSGFTLIEVMVALAILAVVAVSASRASHAYLRSVDNLKQRTLAHFVAQNSANELRITGEMITRQTQRRVENGGYEWEVTFTPSALNKDALNYSAQSGSDAKQVFIQVAPIINDEIKNTVTDITIILAKNDNVEGSNGELSR